MKSLCLVTIFLLIGAESFADEAVLHLTNGGFVPGELKSSEMPSVLRWQSALFTQPFEFSMDGVSAVHYAVPPMPPKPTGEYCFELAAGDVLFGELLGLTDDAAELEVARFGRLHLPRDQIRRMYRWSKGADVIYLGPNGLTDWRELMPEKKWREEGGQLVTDQPGATLRGDFGIPAQAMIEFEISWKGQPKFMFALGVDDNEASVRNAFRFEVWDGDLVVLAERAQEADVASVQEVNGSEGRLHVQTYLDQAKGRLLLFSPSGTPLADLQVSSKKPRIGGGLRLINWKGTVRLERLRISRWDGTVPREVQSDKSRLHRSDGSIVYGQLVGFDSNTKQFTVRDGQEETRVSADQLAGVFVAAPEAAAPAEMPSRTFRAVYLDGTRLSGKLTQIDDRRLQLTSPGIREPLSLPLSELRSLTVLRHESALATASDSQPSEGRAGRLELDGLRLFGRLTNGREQPEASCLVWQPDHSAAGSPLRPGISGRIVYREPPPPPKPTPPQPQVQRPVGFADAFLKALAGGPNQAQAVATGGRRSLHLRSGDTIPCEVTKIDEEGVTIKTPLSDATFVTHSQIKAVELSATDAPPKLNKTKRERLLTLPRLLRDSPPTHLIRSKNGDFLRGRVIELDGQKLHIEVRLENKVVPRDRIAQIIWLHADELNSPSGERGPPQRISLPANSSKNDSNTTPDNRGADPLRRTPLAEGKGATRVQTLRSDGIRLTFFPEQLEDKKLSGKSDVLGTCHADLTQVDQLLIGGSIEKAAADLVYHKWKLHHATEPKIAQDIDGSNPDGRAPGTDSPLVGKPAPDFELALLDGKKFRLSDSKGKLVVLDFWATWCGPCLQAMPQVDRVVHEFDGQGVQLVAINLEEPAKQITSTLERHKLQLTVALDQDGVVAAKYQATAIPLTVIIDREGKVARFFVGGGPHLADQLRDALRSLLANGVPKGPGQ